MSVYVVSVTLDEIPLAVDVTVVIVTLRNSGCTVLLPTVGKMYSVEVVAFACTVPPTKLSVPQVYALT